MNLTSKNLTKILKDMGIKPESLTLENKIVLALHLLPAVIKDGHLISIGAPGVGKTTAIIKSSEKVANIKTLSSASFFGNQQKQEKGIISDENDIAYFEQASGIENIGRELIGNIFTHCTGGSADRLKKENLNDNRTSIVALGNPEEDYYHVDYGQKINFPKKIDKDYLQCLPSEFAKRQGLERFIILPSFLMEKIENKSKEREKQGILELPRIEVIEWNIKNEDFDARQYEEACKIITFLNYILNENSDKLEEDKNLFNGFIEIAKSIINLKNGEHKAFYRNSAGRILALLLLESEDLKIEDIEEAYFYKNRTLIKKKSEDFFRKIALNPFGKIENYREFTYYQKNKVDYIAEIIDISDDSMELKQKYYPLYSNYYKVDLSKISGENLNPLELRIQKLEEENLRKDEEFEALKKLYNNLVQNIYVLKDQRYINWLELPILSLKDNKERHLEYFQEVLQHSGEFKFKNKLEKTNVGKLEDKFYLINFSDYIKFEEKEM